MKVLDCFEKTVFMNQSEIAVDDGNICLTWSELYDMSRRIGTAFSKKIKRQNPVVLLMEKSAMTLATMFGTIYAGCFYVMVDPTQPPERMSKIFQVLSPEIVVMENGCKEVLTQIGYEGTTYLFTEVLKEEIDEEQLNGIRKESKETDILYGIFTSGSTGVPKCIVASHKGVVDFISHFVELFHFTKEDRIGNQAPFDFDVSVKDIYTSVMTGARLVLIPKKLFSTPPKLLDYLCDKKVTSLTWAVSALTLVSTLKGLKYKIPYDVKKILFSGEVMPTKQLRLWQEALPDTKFVNLYGPSEIICNCTYYPIEKMVERDEKLPIGTAFPGRSVFLLDESGQEITATNQVGEICVSGESLSEGYYHNEEETAKRFVVINKENQQIRYYRTGDLGYYDKDHLLYFSGRKDFQIKHMGHRIELEEIEHALNGVQGIDKSCCLMDEKRRRLVAFYYGEILEEQVREQLKKKVPIYMVPHKIIKTEVMPLNKNGKLDRAYLKAKL